MKNKIYIRAFFGSWQEVTQEKAKDFITKLMAGLQCAQEDKLINAQKHLKGIDIQQLLNTTTKKENE